MSFSLTSHNIDLRNLNIAWLILPSLAVVLRIWSRLTMRSQKFWWDDWFIIASLVVNVASQALSLQSVSDGYGYHLTQFTVYEQLSKVLKDVYAALLLSVIAIALPKYSVLFFYARLFKKSSQLFRISLYSAAAFVTLETLYSCIFLIFQCTPIKKFWLPLEPGYCHHPWNWHLAGSILIVAADIWIVLLPLPVLWKLHAERSRKVQLTILFICGYCVVAVSMGRMVSMIQAGRTFGSDVTYDSLAYSKWGLSEGPISIISICLPNIYHLVKRARQHGFKALFTRREYTRKPSDHSDAALNRARFVRNGAGFGDMSENEIKTGLTQDSLVREVSGVRGGSESTVASTRGGEHVELGEVQLGYNAY